MKTERLKNNFHVYKKMFFLIILSIKYIYFYKTNNDNFNLIEEMTYFKLKRYKILNGK